MSEQEKNYVQAVALQIFLKKMPTTPLTGETIKGFRSSIEQSVEIAQLYVQMSNELMEEKK